MLGRQADGEALAPLLAPPGQDRTPPLCFHPRSESVLIDPPPIARAVCRTHKFPLVRREALATLPPVDLVVRTKRAAYAATAPVLCAELLAGVGRLT